MSNMSITMKRVDIIAKLEEMMPLYKAEDKRLAAIYKRESEEFAQEVKKNARALANMSKTELVKRVNSGVADFLRTGQWDSRWGRASKYEQHCVLDCLNWGRQRGDTPYKPKNSYEAIAQGIIKHLSLSSTRQFTLSQDGKNNLLYHLITFEPYTETA